WLATAGTNNYSLNFTGPAPVTQLNVVSGVTFSVSPTYTTTTTYTLTSVTDANGCVRTSGFTVGTATITVSGAPITVQAGTPASQTTCAGTTTSFFVKASNVNAYHWQVSTDGGTSWITITAPGIAPVYSDYTTDSLIVSSADTTDNGYQYRSIMDASCGAPDTSNVSVLTVNPIPDLVSTLTPAAICTGTLFNYTPGTTAPDSSFTWSRAAVAGITQAANFGVGVVSEILTNPTTNPVNNVTYIYTTTESKHNCSGNDTVIVTVNPNAFISLTSGAGTDKQSVCIDTAITDITYAIQGGGTGAVASGLPTGLTGTYNSGVFTISGTPSVAGVFNYTVTTTGSCAQQDTTGLITVGLSLTSAIGTDTQSVCRNTPIIDIVYAVGGIGATASVTGLPTGVIGNYANNVLTISGTPSVSGTYNYTVTVAGACAPSSLNGLLTVGLGIAPGSGALSQSVCKNAAITDIVFNVVGGGAGAVFSPSLPSGVSAVYNAGTQQFTISGTSSVEGTFDYTVTTSGSCNPNESSDSGTLTVGLGLASGSGALSQRACKNSPITPIIYNVVGDSASITATLPAGVTGVYNNVSKQCTISGIPTAEGTFNFTVSTNGGTCASPSSLSGILTVGLGLDSTSGSPIQNICKGVAIQPIIYNIVDDTASVTALPTGVTGNYNAGTEQFTISGTPSVEGTFGYTVTTSGSCNTPSSLSGILTVGLGLDSTSGSPIQSICKGAAIKPIIYNVVGGAASVTATLPTGVSGVYNNVSKQFTISGIPTAEGTFNFTVSTNGGTCATPSSLSGILTVGLGLDSTSGSPIQSICKGAAIKPIIYNVVGGVASVTAT